ncbi:MAG: DMT family transporter [Tannerella sp.]|jgi:drug/metabolite transporter (DMT)-like permease|nr:DMT family transporter [Tannerella sp.]
MIERGQFRGHVIILIVNVLFAVNISVSKSLIPGSMTPEALTLLRILFATAMFWLSSLFVKREKAPPGDLGLLLVCACTGIAFNQSLFMAGLSLTSPVDASIIATAGPIYVMLLAALILKEPITKKKVAGVLLGVAGGTALILSSTHSTGRSSSFGGNMLIVASNLLYSIYVVISRPLSRRYSAITIMKWMFLFSAVMLTPFMYRHLPEAPAFHRDTAEWDTSVRIVFVLIGGTFVPYLFIPMALKRLRPTTVSMYNYIQPIVASLLAVMVGQDRFTPDKLISAALVFAGVYLVTVSRAREDVEREKQPSTTEE